jgi:tetratricopeptide (TPR) repeat protein
MIDPVRLSRPQPVGILPIPAGLLLLPGPVDADKMQRCVEGQSTSQLPESWGFYQDVVQGNVSSALKRLATSASPIASYNRFVLSPTAAGMHELRQALSGDLRNLAEIAAYTFGLTDDVPSEIGLDGELLALALMTQAAAEIGKQSFDAAIALLERAVSAAREPSPLFAAQLLAQLAGMCRPKGEPHFLALARYRQAIDLVGTAKMPELRSELWMQLGMACQETAMGREDRMTEAVRAYQEVLRSGLAPEEHAELFALAHNNLGLMYLSTRMSEGGNQLRMAIAVQSFREGLRICDREANPDLWASIQLNLANALQYMPSSHPEENLVQAVELYEELVTVRKKAFDPVGYGRILSNQANALAHLGIFSPALEKLNEARKLFEWHNETELATSAMELAGQIHEQVGASAGGD